MTKFKTGDKVICVSKAQYVIKKEYKKEMDSERGHGWKKGKIFKVNSIDNVHIPVYWINDTGVYEPYLSLYGITNPNSSIIIKE